MPGSHTVGSLAPTQGRPRATFSHRAWLGGAAVFPAKVRRVGLQHWAPPRPSRPCSRWVFRSHRTAQACPPTPSQGAGPPLALLGSQRWRCGCCGAHWATPPQGKKQDRAVGTDSARPKYPSGHGAGESCSLSLLSDFLLFRVEHCLHFLFVTVLLKNVCSFLLFFSGTWVFFFNCTFFKSWIYETFLFFSNKCGNQWIPSCV